MPSTASYRLRLADSQTTLPTSAVRCPVERKRQSSGAFLTAVSKRNTNKCTFEIESKKLWLGGLRGSPQVHSNVASRENAVFLPTFFKSGHSFGKIWLCISTFILLDMWRSVGRTGNVITREEVRANSVPTLSWKAMTGRWKHCCCHLLTELTTVLFFSRWTACIIPIP